MEDVGAFAKRICDNQLQLINSPVEEADVLNCLVNLSASSPPQEHLFSSELKISRLYEDEEDEEDEDYKSEEEPPAGDIREVLSKLMEHSCAWPFRNPVDASSVYTASYYEIIKNPMDFTLMQVRAGMRRILVIDFF